MMASLLLIDDNPTVLEELANRVRNELRGTSTIVDTWMPEAEENAQLAFTDKVTAETILIVTDADLTERGQNGLFGSTIVDWAQARFIPVADYSRRHTATQLLKEPDLFEIRIPSDPEHATAVIAAVCQGFAHIKAELMENHALLDRRSPSEVLAGLLHRPDTESDFALYGQSLAPVNRALMRKISESAGNAPPQQDLKRDILAYTIGHLLLNSILKFPGPLLSQRALCAYCAVDECENEVLSQLFQSAVYKGPFSTLNTYYWADQVSDILQPWITALSEDMQVGSPGELHRAAIEEHLNGMLARHQCPRCNGEQGGFFCPFTGRTICQREDCSVGSNSWIPHGATLCRIERDFYDEWSPILGF
jgi:hypothetical protein